LIVDGKIVAAAEEERFSRRKHGKRPVPFSTWELPEQAAAWCLEYAGVSPAELGAAGYSYDPALVDHEVDGLDAGSADSAAAENAVRELAGRAGGIDAVFTAAGIDACGTLSSVSTKDW
jgi:carbamoyltransferase